MSTVNIAKTFSASTKKLSTADRGRVLDFLTKFLDDPGSPGMNFETIEGAKDRCIKSARITGGLRTVVHQGDGLFTLLYAAHHEEAYRWATQRRVEHHPVTGTLQIVETAEGVEQTLQAEATSEADARVFAEFDDTYLLSLGVPTDWLPAVRQIRDEDQTLAVATRLPEEVAERLLALAGGEIVTPPAPVPQDAPIEQSSDNLRRFWVVQDASELQHVLERPIEDWVRFLHPSQRQLVTGKFKGPAKVSGAAGTGKTVVGMHRARALAAQGKKVLLTSFVTTLCRNIERNIHILCAGMQKELEGNVEDRITVSTVHKQALALARKVDARIQPVDEAKVDDLIKHHHGHGGYQFDTGFLQSEWHGVIEPQGVANWEEYRDAERTGRGKPLNIRQRKEIWKVFSRVHEDLNASHSLPWSGICRIARDAVASGTITSPFDAVIIDEVQDLQPQELKLLAALANENPGDLMLLGDAGQRIYPGGFSLNKLGINVRGRSHILRINYRTTEQIRRFADRLLPKSSDDFDEGQEDRRSRSLLRGPAPVVRGFDREPDQEEFVVQQIQHALGKGLAAHEIAVFSRVGSHLNTLKEKLTAAGLDVHLLSSDQDDTSTRGINLGTMHRAKGLEFKVVFVVNCSQGVVPHAYTLSKLRDQGDYNAGLARERQLLYVSITRARDEVFITYADKSSEFLAEATQRTTKGNA